MQGLALNFRDISERKALEEQLRQLAFHDPLTLLANRNLFRDRVQHALTLAQRGRSSVAVMFLDLDNFKTINDSLGHDAGDRLLQAMAQRHRQDHTLLGYRGAAGGRRVRGAGRGDRLARVM